MNIRNIKKSEWPKLLAFNREEYRPDHIFTNKVYYDWQFDNVFNQNKNCYSTIGLFDKHEEILGVFGRFPAPCNFFDKTVEGNCLANLIVKKNLRHLGYGYLLLEKAASFGDLTVDHTINDAAWPMFMKAGWQKADLKRFLYIIKPENNLYKFPASRSPAISPKNREFIPLKEFGRDINDFWQKIKKRYPITVERNADYLNWRYAKNPLIKYQIFMVREDGVIKSLAVLRIEEPRTEERSLGVKAGRVIDFVSEESADEFAWLKIIEHCRKSGIDFIDYFSSGSFHDAALKKAGFVDGDQAPYHSLAILFNPVSFKRTRLNFAVKTNLNDWYTTKGGGDQDRP
jgi:hypothetical protein